ncbi:vWA domain-containing protein [Corynebacterium sp. ES2715-CONJ3]|uniref:vWA domain-containing protein n=1 Tax=Corynebacterium sp. ES2715-CONJ3 TaxID=2974028 RepID=UPI002166DC5B|nr:vWA domain-containing protein [Corynebacterium sp. ES2715-CONJ3]MCS4491188.1 VWA domain-containing protein [Corynebacterium sp. ES2715-CONJ3]
MGRHSNGKNNMRVSSSLVTSALALGVVGALLGGWMCLSDDPEPEPSARRACIQGELILPVAADNEAEVANLIASYNDSSPVVRDHCVTATYTPDLSQAGAFVSKNSDGKVTATLKQAGRSAATLEWPSAAVYKVGVAAKKAIQPGSIQDVDFPVADNSVAAALVASHYLGTDVNKITELLDANAQRSIAETSADSDRAIAISEDDTPEGWAFTPIEGLRQDLRIIALNTTEIVSEEVVRAGADFGASSRIAARYSPGVTAITAQEALHAFDTSNILTPVDEVDTSAEPREVEDTLFLFDTSAALQPQDFSFISRAIASVAPRITERDHAVSLWNYSSPLNPGVTKGWRRNVDFGTGDSGQVVAQRAIGFGTGGFPLTREALEAAGQYANDYSARMGRKVRLVLITTGSADMKPLENLQGIFGSSVTLSVLHIGNSAIDQELIGLSEYHAVLPDSAQAEEELRAAVGL